MKKALHTNGRGGEVGDRGSTSGEDARWKRERESSSSAAYGERQNGGFLKKKKKKCCHISKGMALRLL